MSNLKAFLLTLCFMGVLFLINSKKTAEPLEKTFSIHVESITKGETVFKVLYNGSKIGYWNKEQNSYKLCIGQSSPKTVKTGCQIFENTIQIIHEIDPNENKKTADICFWISKNECSVGDFNGPFVKSI